MSPEQEEAEWNERLIRRKNDAKYVLRTVQGDFDIGAMRQAQGFRRFLANSPVDWNAVMSQIDCDENATYRSCDMAALPLNIALCLYCCKRITLKTLFRTYTRLGFSPWDEFRYVNMMALDMAMVYLRRQRAAVCPAKDLLCYIGIVHADDVWYGKINTAIIHTRLQNNIFPKNIKTCV